VQLFIFFWLSFKKSIHFNQKKIMCCKCACYKKHDKKKLTATPQAAFALALSVGTLQAVPCGWGWVFISAPNRGTFIFYRFLLFDGMIDL
jgi:hypothetical protein